MAPAKRAYYVGAVFACGHGIGGEGEGRYGTFSWSFGTFLWPWLIRSYDTDNGVGLCLIL